MIAMLLLAAAKANRDDIVDDYMETVRLGDVRAASTNRNNAEPAIEALCQRYGTTTEDAFRAALGDLDLVAWLAMASLSQRERHALATWRGTLPQL